MDAPAGTPRRPREVPTWDLVLKRNAIERLKQERFPLEIRDDFPRLIEEGYERLPEEDIVRLQWYGLYHDKPKTGYFMLRVKVPGGALAPWRLRVLGELTEKFSRGQAELATRQNLQLHWIRVEHFPEIFATLDASGFNNAGGCGDTVRNITGCPVAGLTHDEAFDTGPLIEQAAEFFYGHRVYSDLPRKHKITIAACNGQCNAPEMHDIALIGTVLADGRRGYGVTVGGGLSSTPRIGKDMGIFVPEDQALDVLRALLDAWREDLTYRVSRVKARMKFMVDDHGGDGMRKLVEARLGRTFEDYAAPRPTVESDHMGIHPQQQPGLYYVGFPVHMGLITGQQMLALADLVQDYGGDYRITRQQNFILAQIPEARLDEVIARVEQIGFSRSVNKLRANGIGCTGQPLCNYAVAETKGKLGEIIERLEQRFGTAVEELKVHVDGCPHSCAHHWTADIGLQGTTARQEQGREGKLEAYEVYLRGGYGANSAIGRPVLRRVPATQVTDQVERLVASYLEDRLPQETFQAYVTRRSDQDLQSIAAGTPAEVLV